MKVSMIATTDGGGAGRAAVRLMDGLNQIPAVDVDMIVKDKRTANENVYPIGRKNPFFEYIAREFFIKNIKQDHVLTSLMYSDTEKQYLEMTQNADIVHLHWVSNFVSAESLHYWNEMGKKLVWTFHDRNPMTGGCHCTYGCTGYERDCDQCPEMVDNPYNISKGLLAIKKRYIPNSVAVVTPSQWMADCARKSAIFRNHRIEVIPNSVDTKLFRPLDKKRCRERLGIGNETKVILYCAENPEQIHKGYRYFLEAMQWSRKALSQKCWDNIVILLIGQGDAVLHDTEKLGVKVVSLGYIKDDTLLVSSYAAADVTVFPSTEESFGNVVIESLSCGTPVVGFCVGGVPDIVQNGLTGFAVDCEDSIALSNAVIKILDAGDMRGACRKFVEEKLTLELQAKRYKALYEDMLSSVERIRTIPTKSFAMSLDAHKVLAPYYFGALQYFLALDDMAARRFLKDVTLEEDVLAYTVRHSKWLNGCAEGTVAIWGAGSFAKRLFQSLSAMDLSFDKKLRGFFDTNPKGNSFLGYPYLSLEDISKGKIHAIVIGSPKFEDEIYSQLWQYEDMGVKIFRLRWNYENGVL